MDPAAPTCPRHPDVETRLRCSACDTLICPACGREAAVGYKCPDCAARDADGVPAVRAGPLGRGAARGVGSRPAPSRPDGRLPLALGARGTAVGMAAATAGGLVLGPVMLRGLFFLLSSGLIGWAVARAVYWATEERSSPYLRALALTMAGFAVAVGLVSAHSTVAPANALLLAYPAAVYGGWIVVRQR